MKWRISPGKLVFFVITLLAITLSVIMLVFRPQPPELEPPEEQRIAVTVLRVEPQRMVDAITLPGRVEPYTDVTVAAEQAGRIIERAVSEGDRVSRGETMLRIDDRQWRTAHQRAELAARDARRDLDRQRELRATGAISQSAMEAIETRSESAELAMQETALQLEKCTIVAPMDGIVEAHMVSAGEYVNPGQAIFRLLDGARVRIAFDVSERDIGSLRHGDSYRFTIDALSGQSFDGRLNFVTTAANPANNAFRAELISSDHDGRIRPGMVGRIRFDRRTISDAILLPLQAVVPLQGESVVYVFEDGYAIRRIVRMGATVDSKVVIREGIQAGDMVILDGNRAVLDGTPVKVIEDWQPAPVGDLEQ